jgi:hypothetical protein
MRTPIVTEITRRPEPVAHDTFIDDLRAAPASEHKADPRGAGSPGAVIRV